MASLNRAAPFEAERLRAKQPPAGNAALQTPHRNLSHRMLESESSRRAPNLVLKATTATLGRALVGQALPEPIPRSSSSVGRLILSCLVLLWTVACASQTPVVVQKDRVPEDEKFYVVHPLMGYPLTAASEAAAAIDSAFAELRMGPDLALVSQKARDLLENDPGFHPATVLEAQLAFLAEDNQRVIELLQPVVDELPDYTAAELLLARSFERTGDLRGALTAFDSIVDRDPLAEQRREELKPRVIEILFRQLDDAGLRGRPDLAEETLAELETLLDPQSQEWIDAQLLVAVIRDDLDSELTLLRQMIEFEPDRRDFLERLGDLELEIGEIRNGLEVFETLITEHPEDIELQEKAQRARFLWRLEQLPAHVQALRRKSELNRADLATLLYWLVPSVRYAEVDNPPIATDILDHPQREEIVRVLNLGLLDVDTKLHRFSPTQSVQRSVVFAACLTLLKWSRHDEACLEGFLLGADLVICEKSATCGLLKDSSDCLPEAGLSGSEAIEYFRRTLALLGAVG